MINFNRCKKASMHDKIPICGRVEGDTSQQTRFEGNFLNLRQLQKPTANDKGLIFFPVQLEIKQGCTLSLFLFTILLEVLTIAITQQRGRKKISRLERKK